MSWLPNKTSICEAEDERREAFRLYQVGVERRSKGDHFMRQDNRRNQNNLCQPPCVFTNMYFGPPVTGAAKNDFGVLILYFRKSIKVRVEVPSYIY